MSENWRFHQPSELWAERAARGKGRLPWLVHVLFRRRSSNAVGGQDLSETVWGWLSDGGVLARWCLSESKLRAPGPGQASSPCSPPRSLRSELSPLLARQNLWPAVSGGRLLSEPAAHLPAETSAASASYHSSPEAHRRHCHLPAPLGSHSLARQNPCFIPRLQKGGAPGSTWLSLRRSFALLPILVAFKSISYCASSSLFKMYFC